jgi:hypothetical protein
VWRHGTVGKEKPTPLRGRAGSRRGAGQMAVDESAGRVAMSASTSRDAVARLFAVTVPAARQRRDRAARVGSFDVDPVTAIRLSEKFRAEIDAWAARQDDKSSRSIAIRRLIRIGLDTEKKKQ